MCGILGIQRGPDSILTEDQVKIILSTLIIYMDVRGQDSWGLAAWDDDDSEPTIIKGLGLAAHGAKFKDFVRKRNIIMHTRKATVGSVTAPNSHPFTFSGDVGTFTGVHNGAVMNHHAVNQRLHRHNDVDSMHIYQHMAEGRDPEELRVRGALAWFKHSDPRRIQVGRLIGGAMEIVGMNPTKDRASSDVVFCSTFPAIRSAMELAEVGNWFDYDIKNEIKYHLEQGACWVTHTKQKGILEKLSYGGNTIEFGHQQRHSMDGYNFYREGGAHRGSLGFTRGPQITGKAALRAYLSTRNVYLDAYHGDGNCSQCSITAKVKAKATGLKYCLVCWENWESVDAFKRLRRVAQGRFEVNDEYTPERDAEDSAGLVCDWGCDSESPVNHLIYLPGAPVNQDLYLVCDDCWHSGGAFMVDFAHLKVSDLICTTSIVNSGANCDDCHIEPGVIWLTAKNYKTQVNGNHLYWLCQECFKFIAALEGDMEKLVVPGSKVVPKSKTLADYANEYQCPNGHLSHFVSALDVINCQWIRGNVQCTAKAKKVFKPICSHNPSIECNKCAKPKDAADKLLANNGGVLVGRDAKKFLEAKRNVKEFFNKDAGLTDEDKRKEIRERLTGALPPVEIKPREPLLSVSKKGTTVAPAKKSKLVELFDNLLT